MTKGKAGGEPIKKQDNIEEEAINETFVDAWMRKSRSNSDLDDDILALIDEHRDGMSLDEDSLYDALVNHANEKLDNNE